MKLHFPSYKELRDPYAGVAWGREVKGRDRKSVV